MTNPRKPYFGPRNISLKLKIAHGTHVRKTRKQMNRFLSTRMKKIDEEIKKGLNIMRTIGAVNQASAFQRAEQNVPKIGNRGPKIGSSGHPRIISVGEHLALLAKNVGKSNHSPSMLHHLNQDLTSKINIHSKYSGIVKDKDATLSPVEVSRKAKVKQGPVPSSNFIKGNLQPNRLKAMPGLVHKTKNRSNLDQGATKGINSESEPNIVGGMKDKSTRCEPLLGPKTSSDTNLNMPKKRRKYIDTNDDVDDIDEDDPTRLPSHHATLKDCNPIASLLFLSNSESGPNLDQGVTKGINSVIGPNVVGGMKDKNMRCEPLPGPKTFGDTNLNMPKKRRKYIDTNDDVNDIDGHQRDEVDPTRLPSHHATLKDGDANVSLLFHSYSESGPNFDEGITKGINSESCSNAVGGMKDRITRCEPLPGPKTSSGTNLNMPKKRRKYIDTNDDVNDIDDHQRDEVDSTRLHSHHATLKVYNAKVSLLFVSKCLAQLHVYSSKPIDECAWSGILKIDNKEYISLAGHLSTKSGEKIWNMSKLLRRVVEATKVGRSEVWPKRWEASRPTSDNIGLYFFPYKMRHDKYHDHIVKEVMENDLALRVVIDEAEMLIFPSNLLPEQYQTFQSKHYLWGVFRPRVAEGKHGDESQHVDNTAEPATNATTSVPNDATVAALPTEANQGRTDSSIGAFPGKVVSFVVRQTPSVEQLIKQMEREGALIVAMRGGDASRRWVLA